MEVEDCGAVCLNDISCLLFLNHVKTVSATHNLLLDLAILIVELKGDLMPERVVTERQGSHKII